MAKEKEKEKKINVFIPYTLAVGIRTWIRSFRLSERDICEPKPKKSFLHKLSASTRICSGHYKINRDEFFAQHRLIYIVLDLARYVQYICLDQYVIIAQICCVSTFIIIRIGHPAQ